jgi:hypothetical protein
MRTTSSRFTFLLLGALLINVASQAQVELHVLGIAQDAVTPQLGCTKACCMEEGKPRPRISVVSLGVIQSDPSKLVLIEATPGISSQWDYLTNQNKGVESHISRTILSLSLRISRVGYLFVL